MNFISGAKGDLCEKIENSKNMIFLNYFKILLLIFYAISLAYGSFFPSPLYVSLYMVLFSSLIPGTTVGGMNGLLTSSAEFFQLRKVR